MLIKAYTNIIKALSLNQSQHIISPIFFFLLPENEEAPSGVKQSGNAKISFHDDDYFKIMKRLAEQQAALPMGSTMSGIQGLGGPLYEDTRIVEGGQGDERDAPMEGTRRGYRRDLSTFGVWE